MPRTPASFLQIVYSNQLNRNDASGPLPYQHLEAPIVAFIAQWGISFKLKSQSATVNVLSIMITTHKNERIAPGTI
uniref:Uncharacterized protein n=1 Tax=Romanomermis culicivorax TaxID=13658 RepID=A0A915J3A8_ROMCU